jgi:hypothetical protein
MTFSLVRSKGPLLGDGQLVSAKDLRNGIPAGPLLALMVDAALSGKLRAIDTETGEEVSPATPISTQDRLKLMSNLVDKRLPSMKAEEVQTEVTNIADAPVNPEDIKRMSLSELGRVIEATFKVTPP